jgi:hypothetical protein
VVLLIVRPPHLMLLLHLNLILMYGRDNMVLLIELLQRLMLLAHQISKLNQRHVMVEEKLHY